MTSNDSIAAALSVLTPAGPAKKINTVGDPAAADAAGRALAAGIRDAAGAADVVAVWDHAEDAVLAHVVARELGARVVRGSDVEGILELDTEVPTAARAVVLSDAFRHGTALSPLAALLAHRGAEVVAVAAIDATDALDEAPAGAVPVALRGLPGG